MDLDTLRGARDLDAVIASLQSVIDDEAARGSCLAFFPALYRQVTIRVRDGIAAGAFEDNARMARLDVTFACRYLDAYALHRGGGRPSRSWRAAFAPCGGDLTIVQHLLLGMNAHINLDLAVAAASTAPGDAIHALKGDFMRINAVLGSMSDSVEGTVCRFSPMLGLVDQYGGRTDEAFCNFGIGRARDAAWVNATLLARAEPAGYDALVDVIDRATSLIASDIAEPAGLLSMALTLVRAKESRDVAAIAAALNR